MPKVYVIPDASPNAFATGRNPSHAAVAATEGIMRLLNDQELEGVIAHELAHVKHRDILISSVAATVAAAIMMVARMAQFAAMFGGGREPRRARGVEPDRDDRDDHLRADGRDAGAGGDLAVARISGRCGRRENRRARLTGLMNALRKLEMGSKQIPLDANPATAHMFIIKPFSAGGLLSMFSTHPPTEQRIQALMNLR